MSELFQKIFGDGMWKDYLDALLITLEITGIGTLLAYVLGIPMGILLYVTGTGSIAENKAVNAVLGVVVNIIRSVPFVILLVMTQPIAKLVVGAKTGTAAFIFYLVIAAAPFVSRMVESSFMEIDHGVIEAAQSMGSTNMQIITKVLVPESKPSLITGAAIAITTILGYTPMAYLISGGGLGQMAISFGLYRFNSTIMYVSSILLVILVQVMQETFTRSSKKCDKRIRNK